MPLYEITDENLKEVSATTFHSAGVRERQDLQRLLKNQIEVIDDELLVIAEEFGGWEESKRRIDLLAIDKDANIVVIELKRTEDGGFMELQAIRYAAMVSTLTFENASEIFANYLRKEGRDTEAEPALLDFLEWDEPREDEFGQDVRILLVSANFSKELTTSVMWLNSRDMDIRCIRIIPYDDGGRTLIDVQQLIPLPGAEEYQVQIREKQRQERVKRTKNQELSREFGENLFQTTKEHSRYASRFRHNRNKGYVIGSTGVSGLTYYSSANRSDARVEMYIDRNDHALNLGIFDGFFSHLDEIEKTFGSPLSWERLEKKRGCRISFRFADKGYGSAREQWKSIQTEMTDAMDRLIDALAPYFGELESH